MSHDSVISEGCLSKSCTTTIQGTYYVGLSVSVAAACARLFQELLPV